MNPTRLLAHPAVWLGLGLIALMMIGAQILITPACLGISERDRTAYDERPLWQTHFDALSAAAGCGLLLYDLDEDYTPAGEWVLLVLGACGAVLYLAAAWQAVRRLWGAGLPPQRAVLLGFVALQGLMVCAGVVGERLAGSQRAPADGAWQSVAAFSSLGWGRPGAVASPVWLYACIGLVGALGWAVWLRPIRTTIPWRGLILALGVYGGFLIACAGVITALEQPRHTPTGQGRGGAQPTTRAAGERFGSALVQVTAASGAGRSTEELGARGVSDGTKFVLSAVVLTGGLGGSPTGGVKWTLLLWGLAGAAVVFGLGRGRSVIERSRRCVLAGVAGTAAMLVWAWIVAIGLLVIESSIGSRFQAPPTFADALLDASSAVAGANLTTGVVETLTATSLSSGIRHSVDEYQYGMSWLMLGMFIGRLLPVLVVARVASVRFRDEPAQLPPLI